MRAVIFDFDGVLVDSEPLHYRALRDCLRPEGVDLTPEQYATTCLAYDDREAIRKALERYGHAYDSARVSRAAELKQRLFADLAREVHVFPGAPELVEALAAEVPLGIASGALRGEIEAILAARGLLKNFAVVVGADDVHSTKPHPEPYLEAAARLAHAAPGLEPRHCLAFEDTMAGIASARAAGLCVVAVTNSYPAERLQEAHSIVPSLEGLDPAGLRALFGR